MFLCNKFRAIIYKDSRYISVHKTIRFLLSVMLVWVAVTAKAQYDAAFSHYFDMETSLRRRSGGHTGTAPTIPTSVAVQQR